MDFQRWAAVFKDFYFLFEKLLALCKFFTETNLLFIIIIRDMLTNLTHFSPFLRYYLVLSCIKIFKIINKIFKCFLKLGMIGNLKTLAMLVHHEQPWVQTKFVEPEICAKFLKFCVSKGNLGCWMTLLKGQQHAIFELWFFA